MSAEILHDHAAGGDAYPIVITSWAQLIESFAGGHTYNAWEPTYVDPQDGAVTTWNDSIGVVNLGAVGGPVHDSTPGEVVFDGVNDHLEQAIDFGTGSTAWALAVRCRFDAGAEIATALNLSDDAVTALGRCSIYASAARDSVSAVWRADGGSDITNTIATGALGTGYHLLFLMCDGAGNFALRVDGGAVDVSAHAGAATLNRLTLGCLQHAAAQFYFMDGAESHVAAKRGAEWTTEQMDAMVAFFA